MEKHVSIAIDGPSGAGKSSLARRCAAAFGFLYADTGAIYRTVALAAKRSGVDPKDSEAVSALLPGLEIRMGYNAAGEQRMYLGGEDVSEAIRMPEISLGASDVSAQPAVRQFLLEMQRSLARENSVIMDGRDIGTVVLPDADLKIFLTASAEARAERRLKELRGRNVETDFESVLEDIRYRDRQDTEREIAPLRRAEDAVLLDTTELDFDESFAALSQIVLEKLCMDDGGEPA
ncbi:MAG: (d)CMP kinase [Oscillospiraceae bacterium]|nr:(d)CMP kinase [Oscillospiraceae bacterium]